jgi:hypothetical protein
MEDGLDSLRAALRGELIDVYRREDASPTSIFDNVDAFVNLSRGNETVEQVTLYPVTDTGDDASGPHRYAIWNKVAEGIGNLQALREISIMLSHAVGVDHEWEPIVPDWEILACILRRLRRGIGIRLCWHNNVTLLDTEARPTFSGVIRGHTMIKEFSTGDGFPFHLLDILCSTLLTLPALENVFFDEFEGEGPEEEQSVESMIKLLQSPILRKVQFFSVVFTNTLSQAVAKALEERSEITDLSFYSCNFSEGGESVIVSALKTNTTLKCFDFYCDGTDLDFICDETDEAFYEALAAALLSNSTLQNLGVSACVGSSSSKLTPLFLALQVNTGLTKLSVHGINLLDKELSTAMRLGLVENSTLESLELSCIVQGHNDPCLWREALSFLRTNTALKTLRMFFEPSVTKSYTTPIRMDVLAMLHENETLETLGMINNGAKFEDHLVFVAAIQPNTTLKRLQLQHPVGVNECVDENESKYLIPVLQKNYGLEEIPGLCHSSADIRSIFELNRAGRRYLVQDGSSISKGVDVLSGVSNDINSVFLHLLENPRLCDRSAVQMSSTGTDNARSTSPGYHSGGK